MTGPSIRRSLATVLAAAALAFGPACGGGGGGGPAACGVRYVTTTGSDGAAGDATHPFATIQHAIDSLPGGCANEVRVAAGTYALAFPIALRQGVSLSGGYSASSWDDRAYLTKADRENPTYRTLLTAPTGSILASGSIDRSTVVEGFTLTGHPVPSGGAAGPAVSIQGDSTSPTFLHDTFRSSTADSVAAGYSVVVAIYGGSARIADSVVEVGTLVPAEDKGTSALGIMIVGPASPLIEGSEIDGGEVDSHLLAAGSGMDSLRAIQATNSTAVIRANVVRAGRVDARPAAVDGTGSSGIDVVTDDASEVTNNLVIGGHVSGTTGQVDTAGIQSDGHGQIRFNTVILGSYQAGLSGSNLGIVNQASASIEDNVVYGTSTNDQCVYDLGPAPTLRNNDLHCPTLYHYAQSPGTSVVATAASVLNALTGLGDIAGNVDLDPLFVNAAGADYRLQVAAGNLDVRGGARDLGVVVDLLGTARTTSTPTGMTNAGASGASMGAYEAD